MKFSIIIPVYNVALYLRECLDSVLAQTCPDWEAICVDDGSTDASGEILDEYAAKDARFKVIHQKNAGSGAARNTGLQAAQGEWIFFLDGDDVMAPRSLERLAKIIDQFPSEDLIRFDFANFDDGKELPMGKSRGLLRGPVDISRQISYDDYFVYVWQFVFRRTMIADMRFDHYRRGQDRPFVVSVLCFKTNSFVATDDVCYFYRQREGSATHKRESVQVLKDELSHRTDVIEAIDRSGKRMPYRKTCWLEEYCLRNYLYLTKRSDYSSEEQRELVAWFYHELPRICRAKDYSLAGKIYAWRLRILHGWLGR